MNDVFVSNSIQTNPRNRTTGCVPCIYCKVRGPIAINANVQSKDYGKAKNRTREIETRVYPVNQKL